MAPFAKVGGLADVVGSLPPALLKLKCQVKVIMPLYGVIDAKKYRLKLVQSRIRVRSDNKNYYIRLWKTLLPGTKVEVFFVDHQAHFGKKQVYFGNNSERYLFFSLAVLESLPHLGFEPDLIHCHDFHTAMITDLIKANSDRWGRLKTLYTIHNLNYQGRSDIEVLATGNLTKNSLASLSQDARDGNINFMVQGIVNSDLVNTVSPTYAKEIATPTYGAGLDKVIKQHQGKIVGILNGIDTKKFNPEKDPDIKYNYSSRFLKRKLKNKLFLQKKFGLAQDQEVPLIGIITRLCWQKGLDLIDSELLSGLEAQIVVLGTGTPEYEKHLKDLQKSHPEKISAKITFDAELAQQIYAGSDIFLMPSRFEPCGLGQMIAMRYGTIPVVRATGGLADTVDNSVGFSFKKLESRNLARVLKQAVKTYRTDRRRWQKLQKSAMTRDFSWDKSGRKYLNLYTDLVWCA